MFGLFKKDPKKKLQKEHAAKLEAAMQAQRSGDIQGFAALTEEANAIEEKLKALA